MVWGHFFSQSDADPESRNRFSIWPNLKLSIFLNQLIRPELLYLGNPEDLRDGVGDFFARKVMQIPNLETVFESDQILKFFGRGALTNLLLTYIYSVILRN